MLFRSQPAAEIFATAVVPEVERYEQEELASSYLFVTHTNGYEFLDDMREGRSEWIDWDGDVRGRLVKATPENLRKRFTCPECKGCEEVCVGTKAVARRCVSCRAVSACGD